LAAAAAVAGAAGAWPAAEAGDGTGAADALTAASKTARRERRTKPDTGLPLLAWTRSSRKSGSIPFRLVKRGHAGKENRSMSRSGHFDSREARRSSWRGGTGGHHLVMAARQAAVDRVFSGGGWVGGSSLGTLRRRRRRCLESSPSEALGSWSPGSARGPGRGRFQHPSPAGTDDDIIALTLTGQPQEAGERRGREEDEATTGAGCASKWKKSTGGPRGEGAGHATKMPLCES